jgi:hypothetical protein
MEKNDSNVSIRLEIRRINKKIIQWREIRVDVKVFPGVVDPYAMYKLNFIHHD